MVSARIVSELREIPSDMYGGRQGPRSTTINNPLVAIALTQVASRQLTRLWAAPSFHKVNKHPGKSRDLWSRLAAQSVDLTRVLIRLRGYRAKSAKQGLD